LTKIGGIWLVRPVPGTRSPDGEPDSLGEIRVRHQPCQYKNTVSDTPCGLRGNRRCCRYRWSWP